MLDTAIEIVQYVPEKERCSRPYCPFLKEGVLPSSDPLEQVKIFDGWITLINQTNQDLYIKMDFHLEEGYRLHILDEKENSLFSENVTMKTTYEIAQEEGKFILF